MSNHSAHGGEHSEDLGPYWRRAHRDWRFWVGVLFTTVALIVYVMTVDLSMTPRMRPGPSPPAAASP